MEYEGKEMSSFICEYCNTEITEGSDGIYTTECKHYPLKLSNLAKRSPILALADILAGEFSDTPTVKKVLEIIEGENRKFITPKKGKQPKRVEPGYLFPNRQQLPVREAEV